MTSTIATVCRSTAIGLIAGLFMLPSLSGCAVIAQIFNASHPHTDPAQYPGLAGQNVAVMVWGQDEGIRNEWPRIQFDIAQKVMAKLQQTQAEDQPAELKLTRFPVAAGSVIRFQEEHPELAAEAIENIAPRLGVSRLIYIEVTSFQTRSDASNDLYLGKLSGSVTVVEVTNKVGRRIYTNDAMHIAFPRSSPVEGLPNIGDTNIYNGTIDGFATEVAKLFVTHGDDPDAPYSVTAGQARP
jgi:hypothetical protein